jgi:mannosyltransferase
MTTDNAQAGRLPQAAGAAENPVLEQTCWRASSVAELAGLVCIFVLGAILRGWQLSAQSLWFDEASSVVHAAGGFASIINAIVHGEGSPPLYFLLLHLMMAFGKSEIVVRLFSVIIGAGTIPLIYLFGRALLGPAVGLISATLLAISPFAVYHSQEARPYALLLFLGLASCYLLLLAITRPGRGRWPAYTLVTIAYVYTHYFAFFLLLAQLVMLLAARDYRRAALRPWLLCQIIVLLAFLPWAPYMLQQLAWQTMGGGQQSTERQVGALLIPYTFFQFALGYSGVEIRHPAEIMQHLPFLTIALVGFGAPFVAALAGARRQVWTLRWTLLLMLVTIGAALLVNIFVRCYQPLYLAAVMPLFLVLLAQGIWVLRPRLYLWVLPALMLPLVVISLANYFTNPYFARENWRAIAQYVARQAGPDDQIVFYKSWPHTAFDYYYHGANRRILLPDQPVVLDDPRLLRARRQLQPQDDVWLVLAHTEDTGAYYQDLLGRWYRADGTRSFVTWRGPITVCHFISKKDISRP